MEAREIAIELLTRHMRFDYQLQDQIGGEELTDAVRLDLEDLGLSVLGVPADNTRNFERDGGRDVPDGLMCRDFWCTIWWEATAKFVKDSDTSNDLDLLATTIAEAAVDKILSELASDEMKLYIATYGLNYTKPVDCE